MKDPEPMKIRGMESATLKVIQVGLPLTQHTQDPGGSRRTWGRQCVWWFWTLKKRACCQRDLLWFWEDLSWSQISWFLIVILNHFIIKFQGWCSTSEPKLHFLPLDLQHKQLFFALDPYKPLNLSCFITAISFWTSSSRNCVPSVSISLCDRCNSYRAKGQVLIHIPSMEAAAPSSLNFFPQENKPHWMTSFAYS